MWLLDTKTLHLREFSGELPSWPGTESLQIPRYAILSHCWRQGEVLFQDIQVLDRARGIAGFQKIENCCRQALLIGYKWIWIDTCCIDKSSSAELSEAINSMFKWYGHSGTCLVYMDDVDSIDPHRQDSLFWKSRWFTRGWTLQELIAPKRVVFFSKSWSFLGSKASLMTLLSDITKIPIDALSHQSSFSSFSVAQRMSWAARRETTRVEDCAYSLMGLFNIFMPIIYGEGRSAFRRLQLEIIQHSSDQSIFAWTSEWSTPYDLLQLSRFDTENDPLPSIELPAYMGIQFSSLLASSPVDFRYSGTIVPLPLPTAERSSSMDNTSNEPSMTTMEYSWTNRGLHIHVPLIPIRTKEDRPTIAMLSCWDCEEKSICGIILSHHSMQDSYRCCDLGTHGSGLTYSTNHLVSISKTNYDEVCSKFAIPRDIYITNRWPDDLWNDPASDSAIGHDSPVPIAHWAGRLKLSIIFPRFTLRRLEERGFFLSSHVSLSGQGCPQNTQILNHEASGDDVLFEFELPPLPPSGLYPSSCCPIAHAQLLFLNNTTNQAFSVFIGHSRHGLVRSIYPSVSIDVAFHRPEVFSTLNARVLSNGYDHHHYHEHVHPDERKPHTRDNADDPGLSRHCECKCDQPREATTTLRFGDRKRGLSMTVNALRENHTTDEECAYCTVWVTEVSLLGSVYTDLDDHDDEHDARSDAPEWGSDPSDSEPETECALEAYHIVRRFLKA